MEHPWMKYNMPFYITNLLNMKHLNSPKRNWKCYPCQFEFEEVDEEILDQVFNVTYLK